MSPEAVSYASYHTQAPASAVVRRSPQRRLASALEALSLARRFLVTLLSLFMPFLAATYLLRISIPRRASQGFLSRIHDQVAFAIFFGQLQGIERDTHMLSAEAEKTATLSITALT